MTHLAFRRDICEAHVDIFCSRLRGSLHSLQKTAEIIVFSVANGSPDRIANISSAAQHHVSIV
ncbi:hypothetical protein T08_6310 [Trichinella sp. T8]|nr:hypothetical protein T08_6310 [Trichinella sp. T8]